MDQNQLNLYIQNCYNGLVANGKLIFISIDWNLSRICGLYDIIPYEILTQDEVPDGGKVNSRMRGTELQKEIFIWTNKTLTRVMESYGF